MVVVLAAFPVALIRYPDRSNSRDKRVCLGSQFRGRVHQGREVKVAIA